MKHKTWLKKLGLKEIHVHMGMFDFGINVVIGDYKSLTPYIQYKFDDKEFNTDYFDNGYACRGKTVFRSGYCPVIWIPRKPRTPREHATLAHECLHAVYHLQRWAGFKLGDDTEEVMAHGMAHIINEVLTSKI